MPPRKRPPGDLTKTPVNRLSPSLHLEPFLRYLDAECGMARNTRQAYHSDLQQFFHWYDTQGYRSLSDVDLALLTEYLNHLHSRKLAASSIARHLVAIKMFFRYLVLEGVLLESVAELLNSPKLWHYLPHVLSPETVNRLLTAPDHSDRFPWRDRAFLALFYATG